MIREIMSNGNSPRRCPHEPLYDKTNTHYNSQEVLVGTIKPVLLLLLLILRKICSKITKSVVVVYTLNPHTQEAEVGRSYEFQASQDYRMRHFLKTTSMTTTKSKQSMKRTKLQAPSPGCCSFTWLNLVKNSSEPGRFCSSDS